MPVSLVVAPPYARPGENLYDHTQQVLSQGLVVQPDSDEGECYREAITFLSLFHDIGKLNLLFQKAIELGCRTQDISGYTNHSELSALAFFRWSTANLDLTLPACSKRWGTAAVSAMIQNIASHHGNLLNFENFVFTREKFATEDCSGGFRQFRKFVEENLMPEMVPALTNSFPAEVASVEHRPKSGKVYSDYLFKRKNELLPAEKVLDFLQWQQFTFASLLYGDKYAASGARLHQRVPNDMREKLRAGLVNYVGSLTSQGASTPLNQQRSKLRLELLETLVGQLAHGTQRIFTIPAATGAGKTLLMLEAASCILEHSQSGDKPVMGVIYALPFLSITQQVEATLKEKLGVPFRSITSQSMDHAPSGEQVAEEIQNLRELSVQVAQEAEWARNSFEDGFIVTTFVQLVESLLSNVNRRLVKLPQLRNRVIILDELQAIPSNLLLFVVSWLGEFAKRHNCYILYGTATMPQLDWTKAPRYEVKLAKYFPRYQPPVSLLSSENSLYASVFDRYDVYGRKDLTSLDALEAEVLKQTTNTLVIVNTIATSQKLFSRLRAAKLEVEVYLLHAYFTPRDRKRKLTLIKASLEAGASRVILVSTQVIEAGVDVDFPVVFRDLCPFSSLVQSAGRCNRNGTPGAPRGIVYLTDLKQGNLTMAELIYGEAEVRFTRRFVLERDCILAEKEIYRLQQRSSDDTALVTTDIYNLDEALKYRRWEELGSLRLLQGNDAEISGSSVTYFIENQDSSCVWEYYRNLVMNGGIAERRQAFRDMNQHCITVRFKENNERPVTNAELGGIFLLNDPRALWYNCEQGFCKSSLAR